MTFATLLREGCADFTGMDTIFARDLGANVPVDEVVEPGRDSRAAPTGCPARLTAGLNEKLLGEL